MHYFDALLLLLLLLLLLIKQMKFILLFILNVESNRVEIDLIRLFVESDFKLWIQIDSNRIVESIFEIRFDDQFTANVLTIKIK